jgi:hypothetical protein
MLNVSGSISQKIGFAPQKRIELEVAIKEKGVVTTLSPALTPDIKRAVCKAVVPFAFAIPNFTPQYAAKDVSKVSTYFPLASIFEAKTSFMSFFSFCPMTGLAAFII